MHPSSPATGQTPEPPDPMQSLVAHLDDVMAQAEIAANAERDLGAEIPTASSTRQEATPAEPEEESEESVPGEEPQEDAEDEGVAEDEEEEAEEPTPAPAQAEQPKYSRRDAARFAADLESSKRDLEQVQKQLKSHQGELAAVRAADQRILRHLHEQSGYTVDGNGRFKYENLSAKVLEGTATPEEQEQVAQMTQWHRFAGPIFRAAEDQVLGAFKADWNSIKDLEGVGDDGFKKLNAVPSTVQAAREVHAMAYAAGQAKAKAESQATIARLNAEVKSLKTSQVARAPQPAVANGVAVPSKGGFLQRAIGSDGLPNPDFDREVNAGKWLGVDLSQT